jgi:hypothetical protein
MERLKVTTLYEDAYYGLARFSRWGSEAGQLAGISEVKLRCHKGYVSFMFDPQLAYKINSKYGNCSIQLQGTRGTRFQLTQF